MDPADGGLAGPVYGGVQVPNSAGIHHVEEAEAMELINDWEGEKRLPPQPRHDRQGASPPVSARAIGATLELFEPDIINVHCYEDMRYPWVQVVFGETIGPDVALRVGDALAEVAGAVGVYFNSLRPQAVYFLLVEPAFDPPPTLPPSRYGTSLAEIKASWSRPGKNTGSRERAGRRGSPARRAAGH
jgi:hypothetical protein